VFVKDENMRVPPGSESVASLRELHLANPGGLAYPREGIRHTRSISSEMAETVRKKSDSPIVPWKRVITVEGRGGHISRFFKETPVTQEVTNRWEMAMKE